MAGRLIFFAVASSLIDSSPAYITQHVELFDRDIKFAVAVLRMWERTKFQSGGTVSQKRSMA
jgi:hypothetical protein